MHLTEPVTDSENRSQLPTSWRRKYALRVVEDLASCMPPLSVLIRIQFRIAPSDELARQVLSRLSCQPCHDVTWFVGMKQLSILIGIQKLLAVVFVHSLEVVPTDELLHASINHARTN